MNHHDTLRATAAPARPHPSRSISSQLRSAFSAVAAAAMAAIKQGLRRSMDSHLTSEWEFYVNTQAILLAGPDFSENVDRINQRIRGDGPRERR